MAPPGDSADREHVRCPIGMLGVLSIGPGTQRAPGNVAWLVGMREARTGVVTDQLGRKGPWERLGLSGQQMWDGAAYQRERAKDLGRLSSSVLGIFALFQKHFLRVSVISGWLRCLCCRCIPNTMRPLCLLPSSGGLDPGISDGQRKIAVARASTGGGPEGSHGRQATKGPI